MNIFQLEDRLKQNPSSALAVRLASLYVARFRIDEVFKLCLESIKLYPKYSTSYLILGRGYAALRQYEAAILCGQKALSLQPDSLLTKSLITNWQNNISTNRENNRLETLEVLSAPTIDELKKILADDKVQTETDVNYRHPTIATSVIETDQDESAQNELDRTLPKIVSATLADIYTKQGEYTEAIKMYRALIIQRPKQKDFFEKNIAILEEKLKLKS